MKKVILSAAFACAIVPSLFAQNQTAERAVPPVRIGNITANTATLAQILEFPRVVVMNPTCVVSEFSVSFVPKGKGKIGPFVTKGGAFTEDEITELKKLKDVETKIVIDNVQTKCGPLEKTAQSAVLNMVPAK